MKLEESYYLHRFLADFRDLSSWIGDMKAIISADELAKDVPGAEALLERHQEHKVCNLLSKIQPRFTKLIFLG
jgi:spectrin alpha